MDESYAITAGPETIEILVEFQSMISIQPGFRILSSR